MLQPTRALFRDILGTESVDHAGATHPLLALAKIGLFQTPSVTPTVNSVLSNFTVATFNTYAAVNAAPFGAVFDTSTGFDSVQTVHTHWQMTDAVKPNTIFGSLLIDASGATLLGAELFNTPFPLGTAFDAFDYHLRFSFDPNGNFGSGFIG
jgi:hypothetical protein